MARSSHSWSKVKWSSAGCARCPMSSTPASQRSSRACCAGLRSSYPLRTALEEQLLVLLVQQRERADDAQGYGSANLLALLRELRGHLRGLDLSQLSLRGVYLQGVEMQDTTLSGATLQETVFTGSFDPPWSVATSSNGSYWAMGSRRGGERVRRDDGKTLDLDWQPHPRSVG